MEHNYFVLKAYGNATMRISTEFYGMEFLFYLFCDSFALKHWKTNT